MATSWNPSPTLTRVKSALRFFLVHVVVWTSLVYVVAGNDRVDYDMLGDGTTPWVRQFVVALVAVLVLQILFISRQRLWAEVVVDRPRRSRKWMWFPPFLLLCAGIGVVASDGLSSAPGSYWIGMTVTMILVGLTEELTFRGILVATLRRTGSGERGVLLISSLLFGLFHLPNWILGQDFVTTVRQVAFTALFGMIFYALRRASGTLIACVVLHALYDWMIVQGAFA